MRKPVVKNGVVYYESPTRENNSSSLSYIERAKKRKESLLEKAYLSKHPVKKTPNTYEENVRKIQEEKQYWDSDQVLELERIIEGKREGYWSMEDRLRALNDYFTSDYAQQDLKNIKSGNERAFSRLRERLTDLAVKDSLQKRIDKKRLNKDYVNQTLNKVDSYVESLKRKIAVKGDNYQFAKDQEEVRWKTENMSQKDRVGHRMDLFSEKLDYLENRISESFWGRVDYLIDLPKKLVKQSHTQKPTELAGTELADNIEVTPQLIKPQSNILEFKIEKEQPKVNSYIKKTAIAAAIALTSWWGASVFSAFSPKPKVNVEEKERQIQSYLYTQAQDNQRTNEEETFDYGRIQNYEIQNYTLTNYNRTYIPAVVHNFSGIDYRINEHLK